MKDYKTIKYQELEEGIGILTLNRPERLNALNFEMIEELHDILNELEWNMDCRVLIITGEGRGFCSGTDLKETSLFESVDKLPDKYSKLKYLKVDDDAKRKMYGQRRIADVMIQLRRINQPVIAAVKGPATGGGFAIAMASDIRIAGESARFNNAFINIGMSGTDVGSSYFLPRLIGLSRAAEILYTGRFVDAQEAERIGFVSRVVPDDKLMEAALELAREMLKKTPLGLRLTKEAINMNIDAPSIEAAIYLENRNQAVCMGTKDIFEALMAFMEKRSPKYGKR
ncbi:MAG: enoyl-CoA hydratase/isomerase family protein [Candidatus Jordarchaeum sp.]|uniref:enoyl-CoA hydratase/isomerase family protein n=1 Tax=Candidatus Jordarchaeum sp. TaxID=2823881 RepID=UPI0040494490